MLVKQAEGSVYGSAVPLAAVATELKSLEISRISRAEESSMIEPVEDPLLQKIAAICPAVGRRFASRRNFCWQTSCSTGAVLLFRPSARAFASLQSSSWSVAFRLAGQQNVCPGTKRVLFRNGFPASARESS